MPNTYAIRGCKNRGVPEQKDEINIAFHCSKRNKIERLMQDISNYDQAKSKAIVFTEMFGRYVEAQQKLISESGEKDRKAQEI